MSTNSAPLHSIEVELAAATRDISIARESGDPAAEAVARCRAHRAAVTSGVTAGNWWHPEW